MTELTTGEVSRSLAETTNAVEIVSGSIGESAIASREITENMTRVDDAARQTSQGATDTHNASLELNTISNDLQQLIATFKVGAEAAVTASLDEPHASRSPVPLQVPGFFRALAGSSAVTPRMRRDSRGAKSAPISSLFAGSEHHAARWSARPRRWYKTRSDAFTNPSL